MTRVWFGIFLIFAVPLAVACFFGYMKRGRQAKERLRREWKARLHAKEIELGYKMSLEEIKRWLVYEWFKERIAKAEDFAREISVDRIHLR